MLMNKEIRPAIRFEYRDHGSDPEQSQIAGRPVPKRVPFVFVLSSGGTEFEAIADEWLKAKRNQAIQGNYNADWVDYFEKQFAAWKDGQTLPTEGTPIGTWQMIGNINVRNRITSAGVTTVEELAQVPDNSPRAQMIGLDWRIWRDMARSWIDEATDKGHNAQKIAELEEQVRSLTAMVNEWKTKAEEAAEDKPKRGRPRLEPA